MNKHLKRSLVSALRGTGIGLTAIIIIAIISQRSFSSKEIVCLVILLLVMTLIWFLIAYFGNKNNQ
jgi:hypothetical protein